MVHRQICKYNTHTDKTQRKRGAIELDKTGGQRQEYVSLRLAKDQQDGSMVRTLVAQKLSTDFYICTMTFVHV